MLVGLSAALNKSKEIILGLRILTFVVMVVLMVTLLLGSLHDTLHLYIHRLQFTHLNVARGLYEALADNAHTQSYSNDPFYSGFSTSEIQILVDYASKEFISSPQFVVSGIWNYCYGTFNSTELSGDNINMPVIDDIHRNSTVLSCLEPPEYYLNYRAILGQIGLTIVLEYAYRGNYSSNASYKALMDALLRVMKMFPTCLIFVCCAQIFMLLLSCAVYFIASKNSKKNHLAVLLEHTCALLSLGCLVAVFVAVISLIIVSFRLKTAVSDELGDFGISLHLGRLFFTLLWLLFVVAFFNFCAWGGVTWCTAPSAKPQKDPERRLRSHHRDSLADLAGLNQISKNSPLFHGSPAETIALEDELKDDITFVKRTNTAKTQLYSQRGRSGSSAAATTRFPSQRSRFYDLRSTNAKQKTNSSSDLISMVSVNDNYANNVNYNQILDSNSTPSSKAMNYSGFGLRKNGTIKRNLTGETPPMTDIDIEDHVLGTGPSDLSQPSSSYSQPYNFQQHSAKYGYHFDDYKGSSYK